MLRRGQSSSHSRPLPRSARRRIVTTCAFPLLAALAAACGCAAQGEYWEQSGTANLRSGAGAPSARAGNISVWTGTHLFVWAGTNGTTTNTGGMYNPATDTWEPRPNLNSGINAPSARQG